MHTTTHNVPCNDLSPHLPQVCFLHAIHHTLYFNNYKWLTGVDLRLKTTSGLISQVTT